MDGSRSKLEVEFVNVSVIYFHCFVQDAILRKAVQDNGGKNWKQIALQIQGKTEVQCLHRWTKVLNPKLTKGPWTEEVRLKSRWRFRL